MVDPSSLGNPWGTDWEFYSCNIFYWLNVLSDLGFNNLTPPDQPALTSFCDGYLEHRGFTSGPLFPLLAYIAYKIGSIIPLRIVTLLCLLYYLFLSYKVVLGEFGSLVARRVFFILLASPTLWWLGWSPSTDLFAACLILHVIRFLLIPYIKQKHAQLTSGLEVPLKMSLTFYFWLSFNTVIALLFRPAFAQFGILLLILLSLEMCSVVNRIRSSGRHFISLKESLPLICGGLLVSMCMYIKSTVYASYGAVESPYEALFYSFSPPSPEYLYTETQSAISFWSDQFSWSMLYTDFTGLFSKAVISMTLLINNLIYGLLSVSGISSKFGYQPGFSLFRVLAMTLKGLYGCLIVFPSIIASFVYVLTSLRGVFARLICNKYALFDVIRAFSWENINPMFLGRNVLLVYSLALVSFHLLTIQANRYIIPVLPFLIAFLIDRFKPVKAIDV